MDKTVHNSRTVENCLQYYGIFGICSKFPIDWALAQLCSINSLEVTTLWSFCNFKVKQELISQEQNIVWYWSFARICDIITSLFPRRMNQIEHQLFEKIQINRILTRFDPPFYPISREQKFTWHWNLAHICRIILASFSRRTNQMKNTLSKKMSKNPFLTTFDPISHEKKFSWTWDLTH